MSAEQLRCRSFQHQAVGSTARRVVPVRYNAGIAFYPADRFCYNVLNGVFVLVDSRKILPVRVPIFQLAYWVLPGGPLFQVEPSRRHARDDHRIEIQNKQKQNKKKKFCHENKARQAGGYRPLPPQVRNPFGFRQCVGVVNNKYGFVVDTEMSLVQKGPQQKIEMTAMILYARIRLLHQPTSWLPMPNAGPRLIRPAQAKRKVRFS